MLKEKVTFAYGPDGSRWRMVYADTATGGTETTYYLGGLMEKVVTSDGTTTTTEYRHYISADGEPMGVHSRITGGATATRYLLSDPLGSVEAIVDSAGVPLVNQSFTPYGLPRDPSDWSGSPSSTGEQYTRQGFTFQTMLGRLGMNHMNGRVQDARTGQFLSPDPFVMEPGNTQNWNRYAYVENDPLSYVDPSGFDKAYPGMGCLQVFMYQPPMQNDYSTVPIPTGAMSLRCPEIMDTWVPGSNGSGYGSWNLIRVSRGGIGTIDSWSSTVVAFAARNNGDEDIPFTLEEPALITALRKSNPNLEGHLKKLESLTPGPIEEQLAVYQMDNGTLFFNTSIFVPAYNPVTGKFTELAWRDPSKPHFPVYRSGKLVIVVHTHNLLAAPKGSTRCRQGCSEVGPSPKDMVTANNYPDVFHVIIARSVYRGQIRYFYYGARANIYGR